MAGPKALFLDIRHGPAALPAHLYRIAQIE
jgi:hypothetical protein